MKIIHRISISAGAAESAAFGSAGVTLAPGFNTIKIEETDARWPAVRALAKQFEAVDVPSTIFSKQELAAAQYFAMLPAWHCGYPEPSLDQGYLAATFDLTNYCSSCGIGATQVAPFRIKEEPKWKNNSVLQLNWVFDEYFTKPEVWTSTFQTIGVACREVLHHKSSKPLKTIVQLEVDRQVACEVASLPKESCEQCGREKYRPVARGFLPLPKRMDAPIVKSKEYFGSGASAHHLVFVNRALYETPTLQGIKGVEFAPCGETLPEQPA